MLTSDDEVHILTESSSASSVRKTVENQNLW